MRVKVGDQVIDFNFPGNFKWVITAVLIAGVVYTAYKAHYVVQQDEEAVITRFGRYLDTKGPGLHFKIPYVDRAQEVQSARQQTLEFGFGTTSATNPLQYRKSGDERALEKNMVTGDLNEAQVEWIVQYTITDPKGFLFNVAEPVETLRNASESVMREVVGDRTVDEVITVGRQEIAATCVDKLASLVELYEIGITVDQVFLNNVGPPQSVQASFTEVNQAQQDRETAINIANGEYNRMVPKARGDADKMISEAKGYATKRVNEAEGDVAKFVALYGEYKKSPDVTRRRIYLETMEKVLPSISKKVIIDEKGAQPLPLLPLDALRK